MPRVPLSDDDRALLRQIMEAVGLNKRTLSKEAGVGESWLSQALAGVRLAPDRDKLELIARRLVHGLKERPADIQFPEERIRVALPFLSRFTDAAAALAPPKIYPPGGPVPVDAAHYIERFEDREALSALEALPFTMLVSGPVQCGKSSLLARLEHRARRIGIETAWFDPRLPARLVLERGKPEPDLNAAAAVALCELLQAQWTLEPPREAPDSIPKVVRWLHKALIPTKSKPRLFVLDDLATLGERAADDWLSLFVRAMHNDRATGGAQVSIAVGVTLQFGQDFTRKLLTLSSIVHWWPRVQIGWLGRKDVAILERKVARSSPPASNLFDLFAGQPYLTHAAAVDGNFFESVQRWARKPKDEVLARPIRGAQQYRRHSNAIQHAILGRALEPSAANRALLQSFVDACSGKAPQDPDHELFLRKSKLLDDRDQPAIPIYALIADDLRELIKR